MRELAPRVRLIAQLVDALELSCTVAQTRRYGSMPIDELEAALAHLAASRDGVRGPLPTPWSVTLDGAPAPVYLLQSSPRRGWRYALESPAWLLLVSADGGARPRFCVQLRSQRLLVDGPLAAWWAARDWVEGNLMPLVGRLVTEQAVWRISRVDVAADVAGNVLHASDSASLTTRARNLDRHELPATTHERGRVFTGFDIGSRGGAAYARLYLKSLQAPPDAPVRELWRQRGYDPSRHGDRVWRVEFEVRPALLRQLRVGGAPLPADPDSLLSEHLDSVWAYLAGSWLTLRDRRRNATRRERTPLAPWWESLARLRGLNGGGAAAPGLAVSRDRTRRGDRDRLLALALGAAAGIAALDGTADLNSTLLALQDFAELKGGGDGFAKRTDAARARYGLPTLAAARRRTLLPDALPVVADAA